MPPFTNIAQAFEAVSREFSGRPSLWYPEKRGYQFLTFSTLWHYSGLIAASLKTKGVQPGDKTWVMLKPSPELMATVMALFRIGAVPVMIDPGMGVERLLECAAQVKPTAIIALPLVHWFRLIRPKALRSIQNAFAVGRFAPFGVHRLPNAAGMLAQVRSKRPLPEAPPMYHPAPHETAAILFTTGSTGPAKGVVYTHEVFLSQTSIIQNTYGAGADYFDMPVFPLFALFAAALGMPCVIPPMDSSRPAQADPVKMLKLINRFKVSFSFGSPAFWQRMADYCEPKNLSLHSLQRVLMAGAPPSPDLLKTMRRILPDDAQIMIPYGATEALPIATFTGREILTETAKLTAEGKGHCVGYPVEKADIRIIHVIDAPIEKWEDALALPDGEIGEITVSGPMVTPVYEGLPEATRNAKIYHADGTIRHRMGDLGYRDTQGRIWFCGRKTHRVITEQGTLYPVCCEAIFNALPQVRRSALVGIGQDRTTPVIIVEPKADCFPESPEAKAEFIQKLKDAGEKSKLTAEIKEFRFHPDFPVDIRHNAKIFREKLAIWADSQEN